MYYSFIWVDNSLDYINRPNEIFDETQAVPIRKRKTSRKIDLEVGDLLLYQGPNVAHWREKLLGEYSYHIFVHFYNVNGHTHMLPNSDSAYESVPQKYQYRQEEFNPLMYDGRVSRYHPIEYDSWRRKSFDTFMSNCLKTSKKRAKILGNPNTASTLGFPCTQDTMLVFNSHLYHGHDANKLESERVGLSWNGLVNFIEKDKDLYRIRFAKET